MEVNLHSKITKDRLLTVILFTQTLSKANHSHNNNRIKPAYEVIDVILTYELEYATCNSV